MDFRTELQIKPLPSKIAYNHKLLFLGSCFAENISAYFERFKFQVQKNPFGITYHPLAIKKVVDIALDSDYQPEQQSFEHNDLWSNFNAHSSLSSLSKNQLISNLKSAKQQTKAALKHSDFIFISLGTAWIYKHLERNIVVNNCHKLPQDQFEKQLMTLSEVENTLSIIIQKIQYFNPNVNVIFTLSPVRHLKDGFVENQRSKSTLHLGIQTVLESFKNIHYFPSYELLLDDLRDYRFYSEDYVHPNTLALDYIWKKLQQAVFSEETLKIYHQVEAINKRIQHRFFNPNAIESVAFLNKTEALKQELMLKNPNIHF